MADGHGFPDLHHKMSKKIAQLTKVIYHLNTKNDDHEHEMQHVTNQYESEIAEILRDASSKLKWFKEQLGAKNNDDKLQKALSELEKRHQQEKEDAFKGFEMFKKQAKTNEARLQQQAEQKVQAMAIEVSDLKKNFQDRINKFVEAEDSLKKQLEEEKSHVGKEKDQEIEDLVKTYNDKYKTMLKQKIEEQEQMRDQLEKEFEKQLTTAKAEEEAKRKAMQKKLEEEKKKLKELQSKNLGEQADKLLDLTEKIEQLTNENERLKEQEVGLNEQIQTQIQQLNAREDTIVLLQSQMEAFKKTLEENEKSEAELKQKLDDSAQQLKVSQEDRAILAAQASQGEAALKDEANTTKQQLQGEICQRKLVEQEVERLKRQLQELQDSLVSTKMKAQAESAALKLDLDKLEHDMSLLDKASADSNKSALVERDTLLTNIQQLEADHEKELRELREKWEKQQMEIENRQSGDLQRVQKEHEAAGEELKQQMQYDYNQKLTKLKNEYENKIKDNDKKNAASQASASEQQAHINELEATLTTLNAELNQLKKIETDLSERVTLQISQITAQEVKIASLTTALDEKMRDSSSKAAELTAVVTQLKTELEHHKHNSSRTAEQAKKGQATLQHALTAANAELSNEKRMREQMEQELVRMKGEFSSLQDSKGSSEKELNDKVGILEQQLTDVQAQLQSVTHDRIATMKDLTKEKAMWQQEMDGLIVRYNAEMDELKTEFSKKQQQMQSRVSKELEAAIQTHQQDIEKQKLQGAKELQAMIEKHQKDHQHALQQALADATREHEAAMAQLEEKHKLSLGAAEQSLLTGMQQKIDDLTKTSTGELQKALDDKDTYWQAEMNKREACYQKELNSINLEIHNMKQINRSLETHATEDRSNIMTLQNSLNNANMTINNLKKEIEVKMKEHQEELTHKENQLRDAHRVDRDRMIQENRHASAQLKQEFDRMQTKMKQSAVLLEEKIVELEARYANRPSKEEDIVRISELLKLCMDKESIIQKLEAELKFYMLELENREENYNQLFRRSPVVNPTSVPEASQHERSAAFVMSAHTRGATDRMAPLRSVGKSSGGIAPPGKGKPSNHRNSVAANSGNAGPAHAKRSMSDTNMKAGMQPP